MRALDGDLSARPLGDAQAELSRLYRQHRQYVYHLALRYTAGRVDWAEDLVHDVFMKLLEQLKAEPPREPKAWLYRVTANLAISQQRSERSLLQRIQRWARHVGGDGPESAEAPLLREEAARDALAALAALPAKQRVVVSMRLLDDKSQREIAEVLEISEGYVSKLYAQARAAIDPEGGEDG
ncbi:MAG: RNA polymerase sigma factor [Polyangiaceae bacterium]